MSKLKFNCIILSILLIPGILHATTRKVLFIGDSYTYVNNMPLMLQNLAAALGDTLIYDESDPGGYTFQQHSTYGPTISKIFSQQWDIVVLQEQSERPAFPPAQVATDVYPYAHILDSMIHANDSCTQTMFLMTWGHANGDPPNCAAYPVICTYDGMQQRLRESYLEMTQNNNAVVAPVGVAWKVMRDSFPGLWLYQSDSTHPLVSGSYIETCVLYSSIFHKKTYGTTYKDGLGTSDAQNIQRIADKTVLDSIDQWQQYGHYPYAGFSYTQADNELTFSYVPTVAANYSWQFGDGSSDTSHTPIHTYTTTGTYLVSHTAVSNCFSETLTDTVTIVTTGVDTVKQDDNTIYAVPYGNGNVTFKSTGRQMYDGLDVFDASGKCVRQYTLSNSTITDRFVPGFYVYHGFSSDKKRSVFKKLIVY